MGRTPKGTMNLPLPQHPSYTIEYWNRWDGRWDLTEGVAYDSGRQLGITLASCLFSLAALGWLAAAAVPAAQLKGTCGSAVVDQ